MDKLIESADAHPGFWRRLGAFVIDATILGIVGALIGFAAFDLLAGLGEWARLLGLGLATVYFGAFGSKMLGGSTPAQRLLKLRVVSLEGGQISLGRSLVRGLVLVAPMACNGIELTLTPANLVVVAFAGVTLFGLGLAQLYLLIFNRPTRRLAHDLLTGTAVVRSDRTAAPGTSGWTTHVRVAIGIVGGVAVIMTGLTAYALTQLPRPLAEMMSALGAVNALPEVQSSTIADSSTVMITTRSGRTVSRNLVLNARLKAWPADPKAEARKLGKALVARHPPAPDQNVVVNIRYGFNMGIASSWRSYSETFSDLSH
jgi:uncharacterized RDD family membrane protein YckC